MMNEQQPARIIQARKAKKTWLLTLDPVSWSELMLSLEISIKTCDQTHDPEWAGKFRALRSAISKG